MMRHLKIFSFATLLFSLSLFASGCASLFNEDPDAQQTPWAGPADWEGTVPGMPAPR